MRGLVDPVFEQLAGRGGIGDQRSGMRPEAGEQRQFLAAHQDVDRIDLDQTDPVEDLAQMSPIDPPSRAPIGEALGAQRDSPRLLQGEMLSRQR